MSDLILISDEVNVALSKGEPVVALESTIISHGMPYPENINTARKLEEIIREEGCVPAVVAVADGKLHVGISDELLVRLATEKNILKVSRRDLPVALASGALGATTVSGTLIAAHKAGVRVFVTGGIGGVHRGAEKTFDISADLEELAISNVAVVCAGIKSILDLPKTLEVLETNGVPVVGFQTDELPAFYTRKSGLKLVATAETPHEVASIMKAKWDCDIEGSILLANPIPEEFEANAEIINDSIHSALAMADKKGIIGKEITPFILAHVAKVTGGDSLAANVALVENNARVGAQVAKAYSRLT